MEGKGTFLIMLLVIVVLVVTTAVLTIFIFYGNVSNKEPSAPKETEKQEVSMPADEELGCFELFSGPKFYNMKPGDENPSPIIQVNITLYYYKKVKNIKDTEQKITQYSSKIKELIGLYFQEKTIEEIKSNPQFWLEAKEGLKRQINALLTSNQKNKEDIIYEVVFESWNYQ